MTTATNPDIVYIGFVLGHGGDAAQMLELAAGMQGSGQTSADSSSGSADYGSVSLNNVA